MPMALQAPLSHSPPRGVVPRRRYPRQRSKLAAANGIHGEVAGFGVGLGILSLTAPESSQILAHRRT
jgi:hypothetical protein